MRPSTKHSWTKMAMMWRRHIAVDIHRKNGATGLKLRNPSIYPQLKGKGPSKMSVKRAQMADLRQSYGEA